MSEPAPKRASYADVLAAPEHKVAEVIDGVLYTQPRPRVRQALAASELGAIVHGRFHRGDNNPDAWVVLDEPELHFIRPAPSAAEPARLHQQDIDVLVPDIAGWRRSRMPRIPVDAAYITLAPDWICEVLSPSTKALDRAQKMPPFEELALELAKLWAD